VVLNFLNVHNLLFTQLSFVFCFFTAALIEGTEETFSRKLIFALEGSSNDE
jgi:hypothetical protein